LDKNLLIQLTVDFVKEKLRTDYSGHDWWHIWRVYNLACYIQKKEGGDLAIIQFAALMHDIADWKFNGGDETVGIGITEKWLLDNNCEVSIVKKVCAVINEISFKGAKTTSKLTSLESKIVQDADKLDAIGAIGIARTFAFGGVMERLIYDPSMRPIEHQTFQQYKNSKSTTINHFYEK